MIPKQCKRLAEVDFPIAVVSKHSAREKSIRHGHPSTLHLWWARRPLAACRSMLMALLLPDPVDEHCPDDFKTAARELLPELVGTIKKDDLSLRKALLKFIGDFANWDHSAHPVYLKVARGLVKAAHGNEPPLVVDPFAGGGSIPLEALRVGCDAFASDLNPVACLILKVMLEDIPRHGPKLAEELRKVGKEIKERAEKELAEFYPLDPDGSRPIAYLWARTVTCETPHCGAEIPLMRSFWLCKKAKRLRALNAKVSHPKGKTPVVGFEIFEPKSEADVHEGTVSRAKARCLACGTILQPDRVRAQLAAQRGGADAIFDNDGNRIGGARLLAVVTVKDDEAGRQYRLLDDKDYSCALKAQVRLKETLDKWEISGRRGPCPVPDEAISLNEIRRVSVPLYGATTWGDIFTNRQKQSLFTYSQAIRSIETTASCSRLCSLALDRIVMLLSAHCRWKPTGESLIDMFGRHAIGMVWDFAESSPRSENGNIFDIWVERFATFVETITSLKLKPGQIQQVDATQIYLPDESCQVWFTDPPYYDSIPYAHLADSFYVWLKRSLPVTLTEFAQQLSPKEGECVVDRPHRLSNSVKDEAYFEKKIGDAAGIGRNVLVETGCASIVFAHKTTEGWEALLTGIITGGWCIAASWPIATEMSSRLNARDTASLATSIHLVCRKRPQSAIIGDWDEVLNALPKRVGDWMGRLQSERIRGADLVFACIGPALELYSQYSQVLDSNDRPIPLGGDPEATAPHKRGYLAYVWEAVGRAALQQVLGTDESKARNGAAGVLEEDSRLTALFLWTLQSSNGVAANSEEPSDDEADGDSDDDDAPKTKSKTKGFSLIYDVVRRFAQPLGIHLEDWEGRIIDTEKGIVRLLAVSERAKQLFGDEGASAIAHRIEQSQARPQDLQLDLLLGPVAEAAPPIRSRGRKAKKPGGKLEFDDEKRRQATTLDRVHAAMLLQSAGKTNALRALVKSEVERGSDFVRLANALSALYPKESEEKRLVDAMLHAVPK